MKFRDESNWFCLLYDQAKRTEPHIKEMAKAEMISYFKTLSTVY